MENSSTYFCNKDCPHFPCHEGLPCAYFNCLFCFCPLYAMDEDCGGVIRYTSKGIKDCSRCTLPHEEGGYTFIVRKIKEYNKTHSHALSYRLPRAEDRDLLRGYVMEHRDNGETGLSACSGLGAIDFADFDVWLARVLNLAEKGEDGFGRSLTLMAFDGEKFVGFLNVRHELTKELSASIGDIGYGVRPSERRKGYARAMLKHGLEICREKGMSRAIVGCYADNIASNRTMQSAGGVLLAENDNYQKGRLSRYYVFKL